MRILVFFDLPTLSIEDRRNYRDFRKLLLKNGFYMLQESVYCRMITSPSVETSVMNLLRRNKPAKGVTQVLMVTEKQFSKMEILVGEGNYEIIDSEERLIVL